MEQPFAGLSTHRAAYELVCARFGEMPVKLGGSAMRGEADRWSDIDLALVVPAERHREMVAHVYHELASLPQTFALFHADHLNLPQLLICCLDFEDAVAKVDVEVRADAPTESWPCAPASWDWEGLMQRACGWTWYTFTKIGRGELHEAADGLDLLRSRAVLPLWQEALELPREGFRRAEQRLPADLQRRLWASRPGSSGERAELYRCLTLLFRLMEEAWSLRSAVAHRGLGVLARELRREQF